MCGIVGMIRWSGLEPGDADRIKRATQTLAHRGPDGEGFWADTHCALGFRRLKVIDLSPAGDQPMPNEDGSIQTVFNGEIYNFQDLRNQLEAKGHRFRSRSDTEVLVHGYEEWGIDALLPKLRGMFAFALWDAQARSLLFCRDGVGVKPLYFAERGNGILFASEPKALFASGLVKPVLDPVAVHEALTYRYVPPPRSGFLDLEKLPPGNLAVAVNGQLRYKAWQHWSQARDHQATPSGETSERMESLLAQATKRRMVSDVPLGVWLSGGIDSGLVLSHMSPSDKAMKTFCAGFAQPAYDERSLAKASAETFASQHQAFEVPADLFRLLPQVVWHADEPYFDSSSLPVFELARLSKAHVSVVLSGEGGDEAFGGYERYAGMQMLRRWSGLPQWVRRLMLGLACWRHPTPSRQGWDRLVRWLDKCSTEEREGFHPYLGAQTLFSQDQLRRLHGPLLTEALAEIDGREYLNGSLRRLAKERYPDLGPNGHPVDVGILRQADLETYLPGDVLHKTDRMSMAHGLEVRSPFLDVDLLKEALGLPDASLLDGRRTKPLLRKAAAGRLPAEVTEARKRGFGVPLDDWFRGPLKRIAAETFEASYLASDGVLKPNYWDPYWQEHQADTAQHGERLYALLALEWWYRLFLADEPSLTRPDPWQ